MHTVPINTIHFSSLKCENIFTYSALKYNNVEEKLKRIKFNFLIELLNNRLIQNILLLGDILFMISLILHANQLV